MAYFIPSENILLIWQYLLLYKKLTLNKAQQGKRNQTKTNKKTTNKLKNYLHKVMLPSKNHTFFPPNNCAKRMVYISGSHMKTKLKSILWKEEDRTGGGEGRRKLKSVPLDLVSGNWPHAKGYVILEDLECFLGKWLWKHPHIPKDRKDWNRRMFRKLRSTS